MLAGLGDLSTYESGGVDIYDLMGFNAGVGPGREVAIHGNNIFPPDLISSVFKKPSRQTPVFENI